MRREEKELLSHKCEMHSKRKSERENRYEENMASTGK